MRCIAHGCGSLLVLCVLVVCGTCRGAAEAVSPVVECSVLRPEVFVNEDPGVRIRVTAPAGNRVVVVRDWVLVNRYFARVVAPDGKVLHTVGPKFEHMSVIDDAEYLCELGLGQAVVFEGNMSLWPTRPGEYKGTIKVHPTPRYIEAVERDIQFTCRAMAPGDIVRRWPVVVQQDAGRQARAFRAELLAVRVGEGQVLFCEIAEPDGQPWLRRLWPVDPGTRVEAGTVGFERGTAYGRIRVTLEKGGQREVRYLSTYDGSPEQGPGGATTRSAGGARE